jgi:hypothetical protein
LSQTLARSYKVLRINWNNLKLYIQGESYRNKSGIVAFSLKNDNHSLSTHIEDLRRDMSPEKKTIFNAILSSCCDSLFLKANKESLKFYSICIVQKTKERPNSFFTDKLWHRPSRDCLTTGRKAKYCKRFAPIPCSRGWEIPSANDLMELATCAITSLTKGC